MLVFSDTHRTLDLAHCEMDQSAYKDGKQSDRWKRFKSAGRFTTILLCLLLIFPDITIAQHKNTNILILLSDNKDVYLDVATTITNLTIKYCRNHNLSCQNSNYDITQVPTYDNMLHKKYDLVITLGIHAAIFAKNNIQNTPVISALIPKENPLLKEIIRSNKQQSFHYLDQPLAYSLALIKALSNRFQNIGILVNANDTDTVAALRGPAEKLDLNLVIETVESNQNIGTGLNNLLDKIDVFLAIPDTGIHNKSTVSNILLSNYRKRIPLIGFSSAYVKAGALAAVYSSPEDIARQARDAIIAIFSKQPTPREQQMSDYFSVLFNTDVARSLGFPIKSENKLKKQMLDLIHNDIK